GPRSNGAAAQPGVTPPSVRGTVLAPSKLRAGGETSGGTGVSPVPDSRDGCPTAFGPAALRDAGATLPGRPAPWPFIWKEGAYGRRTAIDRGGGVRRPAAGGAGRPRLARRRLPHGADRLPQPRHVRGGTRTAAGQGPGRDGGGLHRRGRRRHPRRPPGQR